MKKRPAAAVGILFEDEEKRLVVINLLNGKIVNLETLAAQVAHLGLTGRGGVEIRGITYDSRQVRSGALFVAIAGYQRDGDAFITEAIRRGAAAVASRRPDWTHRAVPHLRVEDPRQALAELSDVFYGHPSGALDTFGVTGTNGKTTVTFMLRHLLERLGRHPGLLGTVHYEIGHRIIPASRTTPEAPDLRSMLVQMRKAGCDTAVMEVSSHALVQRRTFGMEFEVGIFTNLSREHLDFHHDMEHYFDAKAMLFTGEGSGDRRLQTAVVNIDDPWGRRLCGRIPAETRVLTCGLAADADVRAENIQIGPDASRFEVRSPWGSVPVQLPLGGSYNVLNALQALAAVAARDHSLESAAEAMADLPPVPGRLEPIPNTRGLRVLVDYAHTDDALHHALAALKPHLQGRLLVVFGCGGNRDQTKRPRMGREAATFADHIVLTSDNPRTEDPAAIVADIAAGIPEGASVDIEIDRTRAIERALEMAQPGDTVLIAGKGHENYQEFESTVIPFDDREVARRCLHNDGKIPR